MKEKALGSHDRFDWTSKIARYVRFAEI